MYSAQCTVHSAQWSVRADWVRCRHSLGTPYITLCDLRFKQTGQCDWRTPAISSQRFWWSPSFVLIISVIIILFNGWLIEVFILFHNVYIAGEFVEECAIHVAPGEMIK